MKPLYPVLLLLAYCTNVTAQSKKQIERKARIDSSYRQYAEGRMTGKINIVSLLDPEAPTIQTGIEYRLSNRVSAEVTFGIPVPIHGNVRNTDTTYYRYYKLRAELRFFPFERKSFYFAPEVTYTSKERSKYNGTFYGKDDDTYVYEFAETDKSIVATAFKFGAVAPLKTNRWILDVFVGFGPRFMKMKINAVNVQPGGRGWMNWTGDREGSSTALHFTMGVKVGYVIF